jgi:hypothetical protein
MKIGRDFLAWVGAATIGGLVVGVIGAAVPKSITRSEVVVQDNVSARAFTLVNKDGKEIGSFFDHEGTTLFVLRGPSNKSALMLAAKDDGSASVVVGNLNGNDHVGLHRYKDGTTKLRLGSQLFGEVILGAPPKSSANIKVLDGANKIVFQAVP